jgi:hypothetical protein
MVMIRFNGEKVKTETNVRKAIRWASMHSHGAKVEITGLTETKMPEAENDSREYCDERAIQSYGYYHGVTVRKFA